MAARTQADKDLVKEALSSDVPLTKEHARAMSQWVWDRCYEFGAMPSTAHKVAAVMAEDLESRAFGVAK